MNYMNKNQNFFLKWKPTALHLLAAGFLGFTGVSRADFFYTTLDDPLSSIGAASTQVLGATGQIIVGSYTDTGGNIYSFTYDGTNYTILDNPNATIPGTVAVGATTAGGIVGNFTDANSLNYGFVTPDGTNFSTVDPSGVGMTTILGISGTTIFGNTDSNADAFFTASGSPTNSTILSIPSADSGSILIAGVASSNNLLFGTYTTDSGRGSLGFITPNGSNNTIVSGPSGNETQVTSLLGITADTSMVLGTYSSNGFGFLTPLLSNGSTGLSIPVNGPSDASNSVTLIAPAGLSALGSYVTTSGQNAAFLASFQPGINGISYISLYGPTNSAGLNNVVGALGSSVVGNYNDTNSNTWGFIALIGNKSPIYVPVFGPTNELVSSLTITNVFAGGISGIFYDASSNPHNFFSPVTTNNSSIGVDQYVTVDGPPTGSSITALSSVGSLGYFVDINGYTNNFLISNSSCLPIPSPNNDPSTAATTLAGFSSTNAVGTYVDTNTSYTFGFLTPDGVNYTQLLGPAGTNAGILTIDAINGASIAGTFSDPSSGNTYAYLTLNGGSAYTTIQGPAGTNGGILTVNGVAGTSVVGTYTDPLSGNTFGFLNNKAVAGPGGTNTGVLSVNGIATGNIVGTYTDPNSGNTYGFIGTGKTTIMGPYGTNGVGINSLDVISGNLIAGTYIDTDNDPNATNSGSGYLYGYLTTDGINYVTITGPNDSSGGIASINYLSGSANTVIGTYVDTNSLAHWFAYDGSNYTVLDEPQAQPGGSTDGSAGTTVNGISGTTVFGTYIDNYNLTHGFEANLLTAQNITFSPTYSGSSAGVFNLNGTSSAGLPITYTFLTGGDIASIANNTLTFTGAGTVTLVASQYGNNQFATATPVTNTISVSAQTIAPFATIPTQTYGSPFIVASPIASSGLPVKLAVAGPATIAGNLITPTSTGTVTLVASQSGSSNYLAATPASTTIQIAPASQSIASFASLPAKTYGAAPFAVTLPKASSGLPVTLSVLSGPATILGNILTVTGAGSVTIAADQGGNANYNPAAEVTTSLQVNPAPQSLSAFAAIPSQTFGQPFTLVPPTSSAGLPVTLSILSGQATISSNTVTPTGVGLITIAANQSGTTNYAAATQVTATAIAKQAQQVLSAFTPVTSIVGDYTTVSNGIVITPPTSSNTNNPVVVSVASGPATISNNIVSMTGNGVVTLSANQSGNVNYLAATPVTTSFSVGKAIQTLSGPINGVANQTFGAAPFNVTLPTASSMLPVTLSVISGPAIVTGTNTVTLTGVGSVTLAATQAGNATTGPVQTNASFIVSQGSNSISPFASIGNVSYGVKPFNVAAPSASSGLPVTLSVLSGPATISGGTITVNGAGTVTLAADQAGNANYPPAQEVSTTFIVNPAAQTIGSFAPISSKVSGAAPFTVNIPTASSGLPVSLTVLSGPATVIGNSVTITGVGQVTLAADQAGSSNYSPAPEQTVTFTVNAGSQTISPFATIPVQTFGVPFSVVPPVASSGLPVAVSVVSGPATISGNTVTPTGTGIVTVAANQSGDANNSPAPQVLANVTVNPAPQVLQTFQTIPNIVADYTTVQPFTITPPLSNSTNAVVVSVKSGPATIKNNTVTITGNGVVVLSATQPATANYLASATVTTSFSIGKANQTLSGGIVGVSDQSLDTGSFAVTLPTASSALPVTLSVLSGPATVSGTTVTLTGVGQVVLAATQAGNKSYGPVLTTATFNVTQGSNGIAPFAPIGNVSYGVKPFKVTTPVASSGLPVTLSVLSGPATVSGNTITVTGAGTVTVAADQAGNGNYPSAQEVTTSFTVSPASQTIGALAKIPTKTYGVSPFIVTVPQATSGLPVSLSVLSGPATVSGNTITVTGAGTVTVAADQAGNSNFSAASQVTTSFAVQSAPQTISPFGSLGTQPYAPNLVIPITPPASSSGQPVTLSVVSGPGSIDANNNLTITGAGSIVMAANAAAMANYSAASQVTGTLVISPASQVLQQFQNIQNITANFSSVQPFAVMPPLSSNTNNPVNVTVLSGPATITNNTITVTGNGTVVLSATQPATANYQAAKAVTTSFSIGQLNQSLVGAFSVSGQTYGVAPFAVSPPVSVDGSNNPTGLPVTLSVLSGPATIKGTNVTVTGAGLVTLAANQSGTSTYGPAAQMTTSFNVAQASQTIGSLGNISNKTFGVSPFSVTLPKSTSGLPVTLSVLSGPATISSNTITITGVGSVTLAADQAGNANYSSAPEVTTTFAVNQAPQTITFGKLPAQGYGYQSFSLTATASSGLPVTYTSSATNIATVSGNVVTILSPGSASITASQPGNANYGAATSITQSLTVNQATQTITVSVPTTITYTAGGSVTLYASASSGQPVTFNLKSGPATLTGNILSPTGKGTISITAIQSGNGNYQSASKTFTITAK
jgi:hypothetical protein